MSRQNPSRLVANERGAIVVVVAVSLVFIIGMAALAIDLGMLFTAKAEAQRAADAAALAGASAFVDATIAPENYVAEATGRAQNWNTDHDNRMIKDPILVDEVTVLRAEAAPTYEVEVEVGRPLPTFFARIFNVATVPVRARATAAAVNGTSATCVVPFAIADLWHEANTTNQDKNGDRVWDYDESWRYEPNLGDRYEKTGTGANPTGYGSNFRDGDADHGRMVKLKLNDPSQTNYSSIFQSWQAPDDSGESKSGYDHFRKSVRECNPNPVHLNKNYGIQTGGGTGPTIQGVADRICQDPNAQWDPVAKKVINSRFDDPKDSPRLITLALYDPQWLTSSGHQNIQFNDFAKFFLEKPVEWTTATHPSDKLLQCGSDGKAKNPLPSAEVIQGRFLYFVGGGTGGSTPGSLTKAIRLIK